MKRFWLAVIFVLLFRLPLSYCYSDHEFISSSKYLSGKYSNPAQVSAVMNYELFLDYQWYLELENIYYLTAGVYAKTGFSHVGFAYHKTDIKLAKGDASQLSDFDNIIYNLYNAYSLKNAGIGFLLSVPYINSAEGNFRSFDISPGFIYDLGILEIGGAAKNLFVLNRYTENEAEYVIGYSKIFAMNKMDIRFSNDFAYLRKLHIGLGIDSIFLTGENSYLMLSLGYKNAYIIGLRVLENMIGAEYKIYIVPVLGIKNNISLSFRF